MITSELLPLYPGISLSIGALLILCLNLFGAKVSKYLLIFNAIVALGISMLPAPAAIETAQSFIDTLTVEGKVSLDPISRSFTTLILFCLLLVTLLRSNDEIDGMDESASLVDFYVLMCFSTLGAILLVSANNLMYMFIGLELMSLSIYPLVGFARNHSESSEASLKYFLMGAFFSAVTLFGIAMLFGATGTLNLYQINLFQVDSGVVPILVLSSVLLLIGFAFKIASVPLHFWAPDVYEGAPTIVTVFMSAVVKISAFVAICRIFSLSNFSKISLGLETAICLIAGLSMIIGSLLALKQTNMKRLLAYSSIAHSGYLLMASLSQSATVYWVYLVSYSFMTIGAFSVVYMVEKTYGGSDFKYFKGLSKTNPMTALCYSVIIFSLAGFPPLSGFLAKFMLLSEVVSSENYVMAVLLAISSVIGLFYYLKVLVLMYFEDSQVNAVTTGSIDGWQRLALSVCVVVIIVVGLDPDLVINFYGL